MSIDPRYINVTNQGWSHLSRDERKSLTRAGFEIVRRLGLPRLRELCEARASAWGYLRASCKSGRCGDLAQFSRGAPSYPQLSTRELSKRQI